MVELAEIFKALSDKTRLDILRKIARKKEMSCKDLSKNFSLSQPTLSHHFNKLIDCGALLARKSSSAHYYSLNRKLFERMGIDVNKLLKTGERG